MIKIVVLALQSSWLHAAPLTKKSPERTQKILCSRLSIYVKLFNVVYTHIIHNAYYIIYNISHNMQTYIHTSTLGLERRIHSQRQNTTIPDSIIFLSHSRLSLFCANISFSIFIYKLMFIGKHHLLTKWNFFSVIGAILFLSHWSPWDLETWTDCSLY